MAAMALICMNAGHQLGDSQQEETMSTDKIKLDDSVPIATSIVLPLVAVILGWGFGASDSIGRDIPNWYTLAGGMAILLVLGGIVAIATSEAPMDRLLVVHISILACFAIYLGVLKVVDPFMMLSTSSLDLAMQLVLMLPVLIVTQHYCRCRVFLAGFGAAFCLLASVAMLTGSRSWGGVGFFSSWRGP
ncbi:MAG: hypothetical protein FJ271_26840 [Planctomycetes bacterium]|nr:hypothetical protein [Planctomycetota bacterium]